MNAASYQLPWKEKENHRQREKNSSTKQGNWWETATAKIQMDDISSDEEELEESGNNNTDFTNESDSSVSDFY